MQIQIDVNKIDGNLVVAGMYTGGRWVRIAMALTDYNDLVGDGFFIRDGKEKDSAGVLNTTKVFIPEQLPKD